MKLISFSAKKVFEYLDISLKFNEDLSIIVGGNGSGKTTGIRLMQSILTPSIQELVSIPFAEISLTFSWENKIREVAVKKKSELIFECTGFSPFIIEKNKLDEFEYLIKNDRLDIRDWQYRIDLDSNELLHFMGSLPSPIFIGLDRRNEDPFFRNVNENYTFRHKKMMNEKYKDIDDRDSYKGNLGISLHETEILVQNLYRRLRSIGDNLSIRLQKELIKSSLDFRDFDITELTSFNKDIPRKILERKDEIKEALKNVTSNDKEIEKKLNNLLEKLEKIFKEDSKDGIPLEMLVNITKINILENIASIIDDHNSKLKDQFRFINKYLDIVNFFFKNSSKSIQVNEVGQLTVKKPNSKTTGIDALSSGERHIVVIFANAMFNKMKKTSNNILIIDEPELSLHIRWQEKFIEQLLDATENKSQIILATHSPDIVGDYETNCIPIK